ncbi:lysine N(6)-hydroxylase/L-ornithine N(5)-oxygenase family protein [Streptomyces macrosporus]|uniref:L-lysine N6-monooxygenase MbtG n=1 Tax=Streptomyces macrosporus TaxID=44032 RepID=A0ABN3KQ15_9ACTN
MTRPSPSGPPSVHDVVGVGFGPSNLALAVALREHNEGARPGDDVTSVFLERQERFGWHRDILIDGATMQVSFLKDLATMRNPISRYGFLSYLHHKGRLVDFINHREFFPSRVEFHDYLEWVAAEFAEEVSYGEEVVEIRPVHRGDEIPFLEVVSRNTRAHGTTTVRTARNVVLATGLVPCLPPDVTESKRVWHSSTLLSSLDTLAKSEVRRFVVVGSGQSAAEAAEFLHRDFPGAEVCAVFERYGYSPADDSPYANRIFDPKAVDLYFEADGDLKRRLLEYHRNTNYSVADLDLIEELYRRAYQEMVRGEERLRILNVSRVVRVEDTGDHVDVTVRNLASGETVDLRADAVVYATGYRRPDTGPLLAGVEEHVEHDERGLPRVARDYRVVCAERVRAGLYLQGGTEHTHGIASSLLSLSAVRAGEIRDSVLERRHGSPVEAAAPR